MTTAGLITYIQRRCPDYDRQTLLDLLNDIQNAVYLRENSKMWIVDESTGKSPVLTTTAGVYRYDLTEQSFGHDVQLIDRIGGATDIGDHYGQRNAFHNDLHDKAITRKLTANSPAHIIFKNDPGDGEIEIGCYRQPIQLTSERIQLEIPQGYHVTFLAPGVVGLCEQNEHGNSNAFNDFITTLVDIISDDMDSEGYRKIHLIQGEGF